MRYKILDQNGLNFLTFTIVEWIDLFSRPVYKDIIIDSFRFCQREKGLNVHAYVIMSNHVHAILSTENTKGLSSIIQNFKSFTATEIMNYLKDKKNPESRREWLLNHFAFNARKHKTNSNHQVWFKDNHPIMLYSPKVIRKKLAYIHDNPVAARLVRESEEYIYSSSSNYTSGTGILDIQILDDIWNDVGFIAI
jgi:REP element-mobilizing transposase RayT